MDPSVLYPLLALVLWVGGIWGWLARGWWTTFTERRRDRQWCDSDFWLWFDSQKDDH